MRASESRRVGPWGRRGAGTGGPETAVCPRDAQMERDKERPRQREASRGRLTDRSVCVWGGSEECPKRKALFSVLFLLIQPLLKLGKEEMIAEALQG